MRDFSLCPAVSWLMRVALMHSVIRSAVKFVPWEVVHTAIGHAPGQPFISPPATRNVAGYALALDGAVWYAGALVVGHSSPPRFS